MGLAIFEQSGSFDPTMYGLQAGDLIQVIAVGGGGGGGGGKGTSSNYKRCGGDAGKSGYNYYTSGSTYEKVKAAGGAGVGYGSGGGGAPGTSIESDDENPGGSGGCGGEIVIKDILLGNTNAIPVTVGTGGSGGKNNQNGTAGKSTSFGTYVTAQGGAGGMYNSTEFPESNSPGGQGSLHTGGGGGGGYLPSLRIFGGAGGNGDKDNVFWGSGTGGAGGCYSIGTGNEIGAMSYSFGAPPGCDGGPGSGVVIVTW